MAPHEPPGVPVEHSLVDPASEETRPRISIAEALEQNWLELWYQPKIDLRRKRLAGAEALARIHHPQHGLMWPDSFLPDVDADSVARLTERALIATLQDWSVFEQAGFNLHLAINVPVAVLFRLPIADLVREHRPRTERWPGLILEVSEDQIVRDIKLANEIANELRAQRRHDLDRRFRRAAIRRSPACASCRSPSSSSTRPSSRTARSTRPTPPSVRPRSISRTGSAAPRSPKASKPPPTCRRSPSWAAISARAC